MKNPLLINTKRRIWDMVDHRRHEPLDGGFVHNENVKSSNYVTAIKSTAIKSSNYAAAQRKGYTSNAS